MTKNPGMFTSLMRLVMITVLLFSACRKDDDNNSPQPSYSSTIKTSVTGKVTDDNGIVLSNVTIKMGSITTVTDVNGYFLFVNANVPKDRIVLAANKSGYFDCIKAKKTQSGVTNYINLTMQDLSTPGNVNSTTGGVLNITGGAQVTFPVNSFVDANGQLYTGTAIIYTRHFSPGQDNFEELVPGGDLTGINTSNETQTLVSLGMIEVKMYDNTGLNELEIAPGKTAELKFPIDPSQTALAQNTIPLWYLDEAAGIWHEEGQATKSGNLYIGTVSHFSTWNCDYSGPRCDIQGTVVDCNNIPMANMVVTINGFTTVTTNNSGSFTTWVPVGYLIQCQVLQANNPVIPNNSPIQSITAMAGVNIIPTLIVPCATRITGSIMTCDGNALSPGFVIITWSGGSMAHYSSTGNYDISAPVNTNVLVTATYSGYSGNLTVQTGAIGITTNVPNINLCSIASTGNKFTITDNGISTSYALNNITTEWAHFNDYDSDGLIDEVEIYVEGTVIPGNIPCNIFIYSDDYHSNMTYDLLYNLSNVVDIELGSNLYTNQDDGVSFTNNEIQFYDYGIPGNQTYGIFEFDCISDTYVTMGEFSATYEF